jgi:hypothetical protein
MPCTKCEEGKYKWGETGECKYDTLQDCESANTKYNKMQPTPLGKKTYEEYAKELKEYNLSKVEKVQLGLVDDISSVDANISNAWGNSNKTMETAISLNDESNKLKTKAKGILKELKSDSSKLNKERDNGKKLISNFEKAAKELGINPDQNAEYKRLSKRVDESYEHDLTIKSWIRETTSNFNL